MRARPALAVLIWSGDGSPFGDVPPRAGFKSPLGHVKSPCAAVTGMLVVTRAQPPAAAGALSSPSSPRRLLPFSLPWAGSQRRPCRSCPAGHHDRRREGPALPVVGQDGPSARSLVDQRRRAVRAGQLRPAAAPSDGPPGMAGEEDGECGQVREDLVFADVGVLRPVRVRARACPVDLGGSLPVELACGRGQVKTS